MGLYSSDGGQVINKDKKMADINKLQKKYIVGVSPQGRLSSLRAKTALLIILSTGISSEP